jgi:hypothetical protein
MITLCMFGDILEWPTVKDKISGFVTVLALDSLYVVPMFIL